MKIDENALASSVHKLFNKNNNKLGPVGKITEHFKNVNNVDNSNWVENYKNITKKVQGYETTLSKYQATVNAFQKIKDTLKTENIDQSKSKIYNIIQQTRFHNKAILTDYITTEELKNSSSLKNLNNLVNKQMSKLSTEIDDIKKSIKEYEVALENFSSSKIADNSDIINLINDIKTDTVNLKNSLNLFNPNLINNII